jgi:hypothetical protein
MPEFAPSVNRIQENSSTLNVETARFYQTRRRHVPEGRDVQVHCYWSLGEEISTQYRLFKF